MSDPKAPPDPVRPKDLYDAASKAGLSPLSDPAASLSGIQPVKIPAMPTDAERRAFHAAETGDVARYWASAPDRGLSVAEAEKRLGRVGPNRLAEATPPSVWVRLFEQISDFTVLALLAAAAIAAALGIFSPQGNFLANFGDSIAILLIVILNAVLGLVQASRAEQALRALRDMTAPNARVLRGGEVIEVPATNLVPGDVVLLEEGDKVAADMRLLSASDLEVEEAALTGESVPVAKDASVILSADAPLAERINMVFMATKVARGRGRAIVCNTGMHTELGAIAGMLAEVEKEATPLEKQLDRFGKLIVLGCVAISAIVFLAGWAVGGYGPREMFLVAVALAVAAIPEGLPAITTITLALGTNRMAKRNALVRQLPAVETLGCAQVICTDKTGTLTQNAMAVRQLWVAGTTFKVSGEARRTDGTIEPADTDAATHDPADLELMVHAAAHATGARLSAVDGQPGKVAALGDATDAALLVLARKHNITADHTIRAEVPFTSSRRMATVITEENGKPIAFTRGAPEVLLDLSEKIRDKGGVRALSAEEKARILATADAWGGKAMRVVALAMREHEPSDPDLSHWEKSLTFLGLVGIIDPPRPEVAGAIAEAARAGIRTVMITGDHPATARAVGAEIGIITGEKDLVITGAEMDAMDQQRLESIVEKVRVVARATAAHKLRIVEAFKARGVICAMTGDGVNDAPAVKAAHIGVAMGKAGTEVTKEAADLVISDDNFATIVAAVEEGRAIYANIRKFIYFLLSSNWGIVVVVLAASLFGWKAPLTPIQILWINLITNGLPALALGMDPKDADQMSVPPRPAGARLLDTNEWLSMAGIGTVMAALALYLFWFANGHHSPDGEDLARARTMCFTLLSISPFFHALNCRSATRSIFDLGLFTNKMLWISFGIGVVLQGMALYIPVLRPVFHTVALDGNDLALVVLLSAIPLAIGELAKVGMRLTGIKPRVA